MRLLMAQEVVFHRFVLGTSIKADAGKSPGYKVIGNKNSNTAVPGLWLWKTALSSYVVTAAIFGNSAHFEPGLELVAREQMPAQAIGTGGGTPGCFRQILEDHFKATRWVGVFRLIQDYHGFMKCFRSYREIDEVVRFVSAKFH